MGGLHAGSRAVIRVASVQDKEPCGWPSRHQKKYLKLAPLVHVNQEARSIGAANVDACAERKRMFKACLAKLSVEAETKTPCIRRCNTRGAEAP